MGVEKKIKVSKMGNLFSKSSDTESEPSLPDIPEETEKIAMIERIEDRLSDNMDQILGRIHEDLYNSYNAIELRELCCDRTNLLDQLKDLLSTSTIEVEERNRILARMEEIKERIGEISWYRERENEFVSLVREFADLIKDLK